jgi:hypothetical protein
MHVHGYHLVRPVEQLRPHLDRHTEHFRDDRDRQRRGDRPAAGRTLVSRSKGIDQFVRQRLDTWPEPLHLARDEGAVDQRAQPRVHRRLQFEHGIGFDRIECRQVRAVAARAPRLSGMPRALPAEAAVAQQGLTSLVSAETPMAEFLPEEGQTLFSCSHA